MPPSVVALDAFLNAGIAGATSDAAQNIALAFKRTVKRQLVALPDAEIDAAARAWLQEIEARYA